MEKDIILVLIQIESALGTLRFREDSSTKFQTIKYIADYISKDKNEWNFSDFFDGLSSFYVVLGILPNDIEEIESNKKAWQNMHLNFCIYDDIDESIILLRKYLNHVWINHKSMKKKQIYDFLDKLQAYPGAVINKKRDMLTFMQMYFEPYKRKWKDDIF